LLDLARDLDVSPETVLRLIFNGRELALLSKDGSKIIPKTEHDAIVEKVRQSLRTGIFSRHKFELQNDVDFTSLGSVLGDIEPQLVYYDDLICTSAYEEELSAQALDFINHAVDNTR
jgi:hypothetical protein